MINYVDLRAKLEETIAQYEKALAEFSDFIEENGLVEDFAAYVERAERAVEEKKMVLDEAEDTGGNYDEADAEIEEQREAEIREKVQQETEEDVKKTESGSIDEDAFVSVEREATGNASDLAESSRVLRRSEEKEMLQNLNHALGDRGIEAEQQNINLMTAQVLQEEQDERSYGDVFEYSAPAHGYEYTIDDGVSGENWWDMEGESARETQVVESDAPEDMKDRRRTAGRKR